MSHRLTLDHGFCLPLWRMGIEKIPPIVPIVVNEVDDPMPTMRRCLAFGSLLKAPSKAIRKISASRCWRPAA